MEHDWFIMRATTRKMNFPPGGKSSFDGNINGKWQHTCRLSFGYTNFFHTFEGLTTGNMRARDFIIKNGKMTTTTTTVMIYNDDHDHNRVLRCRKLCCCLK